MKIKWTNKWSGETGFVREIKSDHFVNTYDKAESENFKSRKDAEKAVELLNACGEGLNNEFEIVANK